MEAPRNSARYCLPSDHPRRRIPRPVHMRKLWVVSGGRVAPNDFYDLPPLPSAAAEQEAA